MPRLLPHLVKWFKSQPSLEQTYTGPFISRGRRRRSLWKPLKAPPATTLEGRTQSLLIDEDNVVTFRKNYMRHKMSPPVVRHTMLPQLEAGDLDVPREMTEQERQWWSSPYLRMLASPIRHDIVSRRHLPKDLLVRLVYAQIKTSAPYPVSAFLPNGIQHPRFSTPLTGKSIYITCCKGMQDLLRTRLHKAGRHAISHPLLLEQIGHLLRLRVLQELEMLLLRLRAASREFADATVLRRLTRSEWATLKKTGKTSWEGAVAVLVVPPVNRDPATKQRENPDFTDMPPEGTAPLREGLVSRRSILPSSELHIQGNPTYDEPLRFFKDVHLPHARIPLYNGVNFFPARAQRAALHQRLCEILDVERTARWKRRIFLDKGQREDAPSHAFVLISSARTVLRADTVPIAIALWRVRMWEGGGFDESSWQAKE